MYWKFLHWRLPHNVNTLTAVEGKTVYLVEQNTPMYVSRAECIEENNMSNPKAPI